MRLQWAQLSAPQQCSVGVLPASSPVSHPAQFCASGARHARPVSRCEHAWLGLGLGLGLGFGFGFGFGFGLGLGLGLGLARRQVLRLIHH